MHPKSQQEGMVKMVMIDKDKWNGGSDEQKMQMCQAISDGANEKAISKEDYILMFRFLLSKVQGKQ